jgi:exodeoxyribonuclease VII small subunit
MPKKPAATDINFETSFAELNQLVDQMEHDNLTLEDALKKFERGIFLTRTCQAALKNAEQKVEILMQQNGEAQLVPFTDNNSNDDK